MNPTSRVINGITKSAKANERPLPIFSETLGPRSPPSIPPNAAAVPRIAKIKTVVSRTSWAKRIKIAPDRAAIPLSNPRTIAIGLNNSWRHSQVNPSLISARKLIGPLFASGVKLFTVGFMLAINAAATKKVAASTKKGRNIATEIIRLPSGGPINELVRDSADHMRPFAFSKSLSSTTAGIKVWAVLSRSTSAKPKRNAVIKITE